MEREWFNQYLYEDLDKSSCHWILELATFTKNSFPRLESVYLYEVARERYAMFACDVWDPPLSIDHALDEADVELDVHVRVPKR